MMSAEEPVDLGELFPMGLDEEKALFPFRHFPFPPIPGGDPGEEVDAGGNPLLYEEARQTGGFLCGAGGGESNNQVRCPGEKWLRLKGDGPRNGGG